MTCTFALELFFRFQVLDILSVNWKFECPTIAFGFIRRRVFIGLNWTIFVDAV